MVLYSYLSDFIGCYVQDFPIYILVKFVVLILFNVKIFKVSLSQTVALMDFLTLSVEQFVFRKRLNLFQRLLLHALK